MSKFGIPLLRRIVGRIKENMTSIFLTMAGIGIPLGFYLLVEGNPNSTFPATVLILVSMAILLTLIWVSRREEKEAKLERLHIRETMDKILVELTKINQNIGVKGDKKDGKPSDL